MGDGENGLCILRWGPEGDLVYIIRGRVAKTKVDIKKTKVHQLKYEKTLSDVPDYKEFWSVDELRQASCRLKEEFPADVGLRVAGHSRCGEEIWVLEIGDGGLSALLFGFPHPNEAIGGLTLEYLSRKLVEDKGLREDLGFRWYIVKCIDPDGARLNEGWLKGPFTPEHYARNLYHPAGHQQIEWTFPIHYKTLKFDSPLPETQVLMRLIDKIRPDLMCSLHNSSFGGVYYYVSRKCEKLYSAFHAIVRTQGLPLHLGEPEIPYVRCFAEAIYETPSTKGRYDYYAANSREDPAQIMMEIGTSSFDYARCSSGAFSLVCEVPYFYDPRIGDRTPADISRKEAILAGLEAQEALCNFLTLRFEKVKGLLSKASPFKEAIEWRLGYLSNKIKVKKAWACETPKLTHPATLAQKFDSLTLPAFHGMCLLGMFIRMVEWELSSVSNKKLEGVNKELKIEFETQRKELYKDLELRVIPIQKLVRVQLGSILHAAKYVRSTHRTH